MMTEAATPGQASVPGPGGAAMATRFAPSPTGGLHLGHAWSAIQAHDRARAAGGRFLLRIEDIDATRSRAGHVVAILDDLAWLGLAWDGPVLRQSTRLAAYAAALDRLQAAGLVYPCFCTRAGIAAGIAASLAAPHGAPDRPYPGTCRALDEAARVRRMAGERFAWRLDMARALATVSQELCWRDELAGRVTADPAAHGDVVLARKDAPSSYHLAVTVDDAAQGISHVVRGRDLFAATDVHRLLQALLGLPTPVYRHHPLLADAAGNRLAKRHGAATLASMRAAGTDGRALADLLRGGALPIGFALVTP